MEEFLREADEAGYSATRWLPAPRDQAVSQEGSPVASLTYLLQERSRDEDSSSSQA